MAEEKEAPPRKFCPNCGSSNIEWTLPQTWSTWQCKDCGYIGAFIVEDGRIADQIKREYRERRQKDGE